MSREGIVYKIFSLNDLDREMLGNHQIRSTAMGLGILFLIPHGLLIRKPTISGGQSFRIAESLTRMI